MTDTSLLLLKLCVQSALDKKANQLIVMDLRDEDSAPCDYFVVCSVFSDVQARAIYQGMMRASEEIVTRKPRTEGVQNGEWIVLDYFDIVVHIFREETRNFYKLEKLWGTAKQFTIQEDASNLNEVIAELSKHAPRTTTSDEPLEFDEEFDEDISDLDEDIEETEEE